MRRVMLTSPSFAFELIDVVGAQRAAPSSDECASFSVPQHFVRNESDADCGDHAEYRKVVGL